jgi:hypothetical protein
VAHRCDCSGTEVVSGTCQELSAYYGAAEEIGHDLQTDAAYLLAYGVLHALYLQQDAAFWWAASWTSPRCASSPMSGACNIWRKQRVA